MLDNDNDIDGDIRRALAGEGAPDAVIETPQEAVSAVEEASDIARDETGKFAKKETVAKAEEAVQPVPVEANAEPPQETIRPPSSWSAQAKADFATLNPIIQQEVLKREKDIADGKATWDAKAGEFNRYEAALAPVADRLTLAGMGKAEYVTALVRADEMLRDPNTRDAAFAQLQRMYGVQSAPGGPQPQADPQAQQFQALQQQVQTLTQALEAQRQERESAGQTELVSQIEAFAAKPENLYFENVKPMMAALLQSERATTLEQAYDMACHADPDIRALLNKPAPAPIPPPAKPLNTSVKGAPSMGAKPSVQTPGNDIEDDIRAAFREAGGRV